MSVSAERNSSVVSGHRRKSVADEPVTSVLAPGEVPLFDRELSADEEVLAALGYVYERRTLANERSAKLI